MTKLKRLRGDLVQMADQGQFDCIVHGCNCFSTMGAGIARQIAQKWPQAAEADRAYPGDNQNRLGGYSAVQVYNALGQPLIIVNAYTQYGVGSHGRDVFEYDAFEQVLEQLRRDINPRCKVGFPYIGMGLAGGDPDRIIPMIEQFAETHDATLVSYTDQKRVDAFHAKYNRRKD